jgi:putative hydrolase of the HAD superfamily
MSDPSAAETPLSVRPVISVVLFDLDDTLFAHRRAVSFGVIDHLRATGHPIPTASAAAELARWHALEERHYHRYLSGEVDFLAQRRARARDFVEPYGITLADDTAATAWFDAYLVEYQRAWTLHDDAVPSLEALAPRRFGVITNGELKFQAEKVEVSGLGPYLERVIASGELGYTKPDPRIFEYACAQFDVPVDVAMYVGDRLHTDAIGAASAGLTGVWIDRAGSATEEELLAARLAGVYVIRSLAELPALIGSIDQAGGPGSSVRDDEAGHEPERTLPA